VTPVGFVRNVVREQTGWLRVARATGSHSSSRPADELRPLVLPLAGLFRFEEGRVCRPECSPCLSGRARMSDRIWLIFRASGAVRGGTTPAGLVRFDKCSERDWVVGRQFPTQTSTVKGGGS